MISMTIGVFLCVMVDDVFSSLSGLTFDWNLMPDTESGTQPVMSAHNVLRSAVSRMFEELACMSIFMLYLSTLTV